MRVLQLKYIIILASPITSLRNKNESLKCYKCGGATDFPSCEYFNGSEIFITLCPYHHKSCLKGWVNRNGGGSDKSENGGKDAELTFNVIRKCAPIAENICLNQNSGTQFET